MTTQRNIEHLDQQEWDAVCERCGRCCYEKYDYRGKIFYSKIPCRHLDTETNLCRVYVRRFQEHPECTQLTPDIVRAGILPEDCPYVRMCSSDDEQEK